MTTRLPSGYTTHPLTLDDVDAAVKLFNAYTKAQTGIEEFEAADLQTDWQLPGFDLANNTMALFDATGAMAGYAEIWDPGKPHVRISSWTAVHPEQMGRGLGRWLLAWLFERARQSMQLAPADARVVLHQYIEKSNQAAAELLTCNGFKNIRASYTMQIDFDGPPEAPAAIDGLTIRSINGEEEEREAMRAGFEAFKDHWGHTDQPFEEYYRLRKYYIDHTPHYDPSLWFIALDGAEVAGVSLCMPRAYEDPEMGWVQTLAVRRPWRKRGLGLALLRHSFGEFYRRGKPRAGLGVDASSLTGAVRLYERAGMVVARQRDCYEYELRAGVDLMTQSVEAEG